METAKLVVGIIHIILSIVIIALILLQSGKQAGLSGAIGGAADSFFGKNKGKTMDAIFARFTKICAIFFLITSLFLAYGDAVVNKASTTPENTTNVEIPAEDIESVETEAPADAEAPAETENSEAAPADTGAEN